MELHKQPYWEIPGVTDIPASWKRELWEWMLAVAAITMGAWFFCTVAQVLFNAAIGLIWPVP